MYSERLIFCSKFYNKSNALNFKERGPKRLGPTGQTVPERYSNVLPFGWEPLVYSNLSLLTSGGSLLLQSSTEFHSKSSHAPSRLLIGF